MPAPTSYTEETTAQYMRGVIKEIATDLNWLDTTPEGDYAQPVNEVIRDLGVTDLEEFVGDVALVELHARVEIWRAVTEAYVRAYEVGGFAQTLRRQQLFDHARLMYSEALDELAAYNNENLASGGDELPARLPHSTSVIAKLIW